jgi:deoxyribodipyrimidine photolyase-related protein
MHLVLHDQLSLAAIPPGETRFLMVESLAKGRSKPFHAHKLVYVASAGRHFADELRQDGFDVTYVNTRGWFRDAVRRWLETVPDECLTFTTPSEWDTRQDLRDLMRVFPGRLEELPNPLFLADPAEWADRIRSGYRMEYFYREMRRRTGYLMDGGKPAGGAWNYDAENRKTLPKQHAAPPVPTVDPDSLTLNVIREVERLYPDHPGDASTFRMAVDRPGALAALADFIALRLPLFGDYEDAMAVGNDTLHHSRLSTFLNNGLLRPGEVCQAAITAYRDGHAPLNAVEGFIRQIIGWREYVRCYYEAMMPDVRHANALRHERPLPDAYWSGTTDMTCLRECVRPVLAEGYSHHIQRLMVLSNYANLVGVDPAAVNEWFWAMYTDAYEWVVLPNVIGMSTFADGGVLASKPYVSSGAYIDRMSDYCGRCAYDVKRKTGPGACPFNALYWRFVDRHRSYFTENGRVSFMVRSYDSKPASEKAAIHASAEAHIASL